MKLGNKGHFWIGNDSHIRPQKWTNKITAKGRYSQIHGMANARNKFIHTSDTLSSHFADFFFEYFILRGIFFQNRGKNILFGEGNGELG